MWSRLGALDTLFGGRCEPVGSDPPVLRHSLSLTIAPTKHPSSRTEHHSADPSRPVRMACRLGGTINEFPMLFQHLNLDSLS